MNTITLDVKLAHTKIDRNIYGHFSEHLGRCGRVGRGRPRALIPRLWGLHAVVKAHYYHPGFGGSYSIKAVLPALVPALAYDDLEIQDGTIASVQYGRMISGGVGAEEQMRLRMALLKYCERDTLAMKELRRVLQEKASR